MRFRMHVDDHERYGDAWCVYDESALSRVPARQLIEIEAAIGMSIPAMLSRLRDPESPRHTEANLAVTWVARRLAGITEPYAEYEPMVLLIDWEPVTPADVDPPPQTRSNSQSAE